MIQLAVAVSTADVVRFVNPYDDALDFQASDFDRYAKTYDLSCLRFVEGKVPTYFLLRPCSQSEVRRARLAATARNATLSSRIGAVGAEMIAIGLIGAQNLEREGDSYSWPGGCPAEILADGLDLGRKGEDGKPLKLVIPAPIQEQIAVALFYVSEGAARDGGLADEGKSPSPSSLSGVGSLPALASTAASAPKKSKTGAAARGPRK